MVFSKSIHDLFRKIIPHPPERIEHCQDFDEIHAVLDTLPGYFKALMLELILSLYVITQFLQ